MCGRFVSASPPDEVARYFGAALGESLLPANHNVAPTNDVYAVVDTPHGRELAVFHWGLVPMWAKDVKVGQKMINARAETLGEKPAFKSLFRTKRCIVPADGFYEWKRAAAVEGGKLAKEPYFIHRLDGEPLAFAGLWSTWRPKDAEPDVPVLHSCTIVTTSANATMAPVHDRMPVVLPPTAWDEWLEPGPGDLVTLQRLLVPAPDSLLTMHRVSTDVNSVRNKGPQLLAPV